MPAQPKTRVFISFDYDLDLDLKNLLVVQSRYEDSSFFIEDWSIKHESKGWKTDARKRIRQSDIAISICGYQIQNAMGVAVEIAIAREENIPYYLLWSRENGVCHRSGGTSWYRDMSHDWRWGNLRDVTELKPHRWWTKTW